MVFRWSCPSTFWSHRGKLDRLTESIYQLSHTLEAVKNISGSRLSEVIEGVPLRRFLAAAASVGRAPKSEDCPPS